MKSTQSWLQKHWLWLVVNIAAAVPLALLAVDFWRDNLGVNPIDYLTDRTGKVALVLLTLSLACTPIYILTGWRRPQTVRKALGMWAFVYASFHLLNFVGLDYGFDVNFILQDGLPTKPYVLVGLTAFLLLVPLAITSTKGWMRRLGPAWTQLHRLAYVAGIAAVVHFLWLVKAAERVEPLLYALLLTFLLVVRIPPLRRWIVAQRRRLAPAPAPAARRPAPGKVRSEA